MPWVLWPVTYNNSILWLVCTKRMIASASPYAPNYLTPPCLVLQVPHTRHYFIPSLETFNLVAWCNHLEKTNGCPHHILLVWLVTLMVHYFGFINSPQGTWTWVFNKNSLLAGSWINFSYATGILDIPLFRHFVIDKASTNLGILLRIFELSSWDFEPFATNDIYVAFCFMTLHVCMCPAHQVLSKFLVAISACWYHQLSVSFVWI